MSVQPTYFKLSLPVRHDQCEALETLLLSMGACAITLEDAGDCPILEPGVAETPLWPELIMSALFEQCVDVKALLSELETSFDPQLFKHIQCVPVIDEVWQLKWLEYFKPIHFAHKLWVGTKQHTPAQTYDALVYLEPGLAFGTGAHPSTYLCLEWLAAQNLHGKTILDYGCGSGILGIAAAKLGAQNIFAVDNDPQALTATLNNARDNQVAVHAYLPTALPPVKVDVVIANILAQPLMSLSPQIIELLKPQGTLVLAGILTSQAEAVRQAYVPKISWQDCQQKDDWVRLTGLAF